VFSVPLIDSTSEPFHVLNLNPAIRPFLFARRHRAALFPLADIYIHRGERLRLLYKLYRMRGQVFFIVSSASGIGVDETLDEKYHLKRVVRSRLFGSAGAESNGSHALPLL